MPWPPKWSIQVFRLKLFVCIISPIVLRVPTTYYLDFITLIIYGEECKYEAPHYAVFSTLLLLCVFGSDILSTLSSNTLNLYSSLRTRDQVSRYYKIKKENCSFSSFNIVLHVFRQETGRLKALN
jgi:hypothetical protein